MGDSDDDMPPPLEDMSDQLEAMSLLREVRDAAKGPVLAAPEDDDDVTWGDVRARAAEEEMNFGFVPPPKPAAAAAAAAPSAPAPAKKKKETSGFKKGFFDAPKKKKAPKPKVATEVEEAVPMLTGKKQGGFSGPNIPDFLKVEPDEEEEKMAQVKEKLVDAMKPTPDLMKNVAGDEKLMAGFDDPEVMAAVDDVAKNPANIKKYQNNPKVVAFYQSMSKIMAGRMDELAAQEEAKQPGR